ncbi:hypothetical protein UUU_44590 [Klebsiella pneumoniae subsp. pneumoniae DSM 30104 = JCM 1662 = NBRC 14940]|nr:hypothetical protein UUU_44590 [Klebsiella pneumoniae subsp. pneumoniae DSM 30104 = JCM 1662 = NBRC 14940]
MNHLWIELNKQVVREQRFADHGAFTANDFFQRNRRHQAVN